MNVSLEEIVKIYWDDIWKLHGVLWKVLRNRGPQFTSKFMEELMKVLETRMLLIAYHPQSDGQMEWTNQEVGTFLQYYVNYQQDNWMEWLVVAEFQYNNKKHVAMGHTPFELNFGWHLWKRNLMIQTEFPKSEEFLIGLQRSWKEATKSMKIASKL